MAPISRRRPHRRRFPSHPRLLDSRRRRAATGRPGDHDGRRWPGNRGSGRARLPDPPPRRAPARGEKAAEVASLGRTQTRRDGQGRPSDPSPGGGLASARARAAPTRDSDSGRAAQPERLSHQHSTPLRVSIARRSGSG